MRQSGNSREWLNDISERLSGTLGTNGYAAR